MLFKVIHNAPLQPGIPTTLHASWKIIHAGPRVVHETGEIELAVWYERPVTTEGDIIESPDESWQYVFVVGTGEAFPYQCEHVQSFYTPPFAWHVYRTDDASLFGG